MTDEYDGCSDRTTRAGTYIWCSSPADEEGIRLAKEYIKEKGLTHDDVRLVKINDSVSVITKVDMVL